MSARFGFSGEDPDPPFGDFDGFDPIDAELEAQANKLPGYPERKAELAGRLSSFLLSQGIGAERAADALLGATSSPASVAWFAKRIQDLTPKELLRYLRVVSKRYRRKSQVQEWRHWGDRRLRGSLTTQTDIDANLLGLMQDLKADRPDQVADLQERYTQFLSAFRALTSQEQAILFLHHVDGLAFRSISEMLGIALSIVRQTYRRAILKLRKMLGEGPEPGGGLSPVPV